MDGRKVVIVAAVSLVALATTVAVAATGGLSGASTGPHDGTAARTAELERREQERDREQVDELDHLVADLMPGLAAVLDGLDAAVPVDPSSPGNPADQATIAHWSAVVTDAVAAFDEPPSGSTSVNLARSGFGVALEQLDAAVALYAAARRTDGSVREELEALAGDLRTQAVVSWSLAATHLDLVNIEVGNGHTHLYLPASPATGAFTPDGH